MMECGYFNNVNFREFLLREGEFSSLEMGVPGGPGLGAWPPWPMDPQVVTWYMLQQLCAMFLYNTQWSELCTLLLVSFKNSTRYWIDYTSDEQLNSAHIGKLSACHFPSVMQYVRVVQPFGYGGPDWFHPWRGGPLCNIGSCQGDVWMWTLITFICMVVRVRKFP